MAQIRKDSLANGEIYHIYTRSIAKFVVFNEEAEYNRAHQLLNLYRHKGFNYKYSQFLTLMPSFQSKIIDNLNSENDALVEIIAYCLMPTHIHLLTKQLSDNGISKYMSRILNGYARYFNTKHKRTGPLWSGRFKSILVSGDEQLLHLTRYIHLNPTSAGIVSRPKDWTYSSYGEYSNDKQNQIAMCEFKDLITLDPKEYRRFVNDHKDYQKQLSSIKYLTIDDYSG